MVMINVIPGQKVRILSVLNGRRRARRLYDLGIVPGVEIELVSRHPFKGPLIIKLGNTTLALGRSIAACIEVEDLGDKTGNGNYTI